ncbi:PIG-L family deacetylase [Candidatus Woesearchaeota archaeon]|nr:PIG-L family deacetylase [Candidatus Woesearchaeota archaeon]
METILFICAHSDDHIIGAGGTIAKYVAEGKRVLVLIFSYGERTHPWLKADVAKSLRAQETKEADALIGSSSRFFDLREGHYPEEFPSIRDDVLDVLKKEKPSRVFAHSSEDPHPDHQACYKITRDVLKASKIKTELYAFSIWNPFSLHKNSLPSMYVDITETHKQKVKALHSFRSQWVALLILFGSIFTREIKNGLHIGVRYAERFYRLL